MSELIDKKMLILFLAMALVISMPSDAFAAFEALTGAGKTIFTGLRRIIYPASAIGIICVCIGGFFGNINWKWLTAIVIGLIVISACVGFVTMFSPEGANEIPEGVMDGK